MQSLSLRPICYDKALSGVLFLSIQIFQNCIIITTTIKTTVYVLFIVSDDFNNHSLILFAPWVEHKATQQQLPSFSDLNNASINVLLQLNVLASRCRSVMQSCNVRTKTFNMSSWENLKKSTCMYILILVNGDVNDHSINVLFQLKIFLASRSTSVVSEADEKKAHRT